MLVTTAVLGAVGIVLFIFIIQNPSTYRLASARLTVIAALLRKNEASLANYSPAQLQSRLEQIDNLYGTRLIIYDTARRVIADSQPTGQAPIPMPALPRLRISSVTFDQKGQPWLYIIQHLNNNRGWLLVAIPRPAAPLLTVLSDELMLPLLGAGLVALIISLIVAFWLARWIGNPIQRVVVASRKMPSLQAVPIEPHGPQEVQELAQAFNAMNSRVLVSQKSQRDFVANVSHELKTPLTSIQGFSQALLDGTAGDPAAQKQAAQVIYDEAGRMHRMVLDLLDLARLDTGTLDLRRAPVDIPALLRSIAEKFAPQTQAAGVSIVVDSPDLPLVTCDGDRLAQVFTNLVDNALKSTPAGGNITLRARLVNSVSASSAISEVRVDVTDNGAGIPADALPHIFDRFYQADQSRQGGAKHGTGLGLAIVKEIVGAHGGKIDVRSTLDGGSTFTVSLPLTIPDFSSTGRRNN